MALMDGIKLVNTERKKFEQRENSIRKNILEASSDFQNESSPERTDFWNDSSSQM